jgi:two-component system, chemotaxis family, chemotaxis protein CheY
MAKSVLIVDDVIFVRKTIAKILSEAHYQIVGEAENGVEAYESYARLRPDFVTMDLVMPKMSGIEATRNILKLDKEARIIVITAMEQEHLVMESINAGAKDYLLKPFSREDLLKAVEHLFSGMISTAGKATSR